MSDTTINIDVRCYNCHFCAAFDSGYSNYTVENTTLVCLHDLNPDMPVDESYSWTYGNSETVNHPTFKVAETCPKYQFTTELTKIDVDGEDLEGYKDEPEYYELLKAHY